MFCKASVVTDFLSPSLLVISIDLSTAWLALGLQRCLECRALCHGQSWKRCCGFGELEVEGQQGEAFTVFRGF